VNAASAGFNTMTGQGPKSLSRRTHHNYLKIIRISSACRTDSSRKSVLLQNR